MLYIQLDLQRQIYIYILEVTIHRITMCVHIYCVHGRHKLDADFHEAGAGI